MGGAGYTGGELLRLLLLHPEVEIAFIHSKSNAGNTVGSVHHDLFGETDLIFSQDFSKQVDVLFLCLGHGESLKFLNENPIPEAIKVIDLSQDFRLKSSLIKREFIYGLPEFQRDKIRSALNIANPGCFATAIQLSLLPLCKSKLIIGDIHISGITGSTGAGQSLSDTTHFSWRNNNVSSYKVFEHQHLNEIHETLYSLQENIPAIHFVPYRGNFSRGILTTTYTKSSLNIDNAKKLYTDFYADHPFVYLNPSTTDLKHVVNTNKCILNLAKIDGQLVITSVIDNLLKGASGQAVQNMNLMFGLEETTGLKLKAMAF